MKLLPPLILLAALALTAYSQDVLYTFYGDSAGDYFGESVSGAGDVNGDGYADLIVGAHLDGKNGLYSGSARVLSGLDGSILYTFVGDSRLDTFGLGVSGAGDVNRDGYADVIVGARGDDNNGESSGSARVFSGLDGSILYTFDGDAPYDHLGFSVSGAGDVNGDGWLDLIVGAYGNDNNGQDSGSARVYSGFDGSALYTFYGDSPKDFFGQSVSNADDVNRDGYADVIVGARGDDNNGSESGSARVFSGVDGSILYTFDGDAADDWFGESVSAAGDVNGDGYSDLIVGAPFDDNGATNSGSARVFSGLDGSVLYTFDGRNHEDRFGVSVSGVGDVNGDGFADLIVGAYLDDNNGVNSGSTRVLSGVDGSRLYFFNGDSAHDWFGSSVSGAGDVNGDGRVDVIVGAYRDDNNGKNSGSARVFSGCDGLGTSYCTPAVPNSTGQSAVISACGSDLADGGYFMLHATDLPPSKFGYFLASDTQGFVAQPPGSQGNLCLGGLIGPFVKQVKNSGPSGEFTIQVDLTSIPTTPPHTVLAGETWNFQAWFRDKNPGPTSNFTDAVSVLFQ